MAQSNTREILNRLLVAQYRSLPMYLEYSCPWIHDGDERAVQICHNIVFDQKSICGRIGELLMDRYGQVDWGQFPMAYADTHDLSLDYLLPRLAESQKSLIAITEECVGQLGSDSEARVLSEESLGVARGHLESLEELLGQSVEGGR